MLALVFFLRLHIYILQLKFEHAKILIYYDTNTIYLTCSPLN